MSNDISFSDNCYYILKNNWKLKNDEDKILLLEIDPNIFDISRHFRLTPQEGIVLTLFNGKRTLIEVINFCSEIFQIQVNITRDEVFKLITRVKDSIEIFEEGNKYTYYKPESMIIHKKDVKLYSTRLKTPYFLIFHFASDCIRHCIYCNVNNTHMQEIDKLSTARIISLIDEAKSIGVLTITIAGGEPFLRKDMEIILSHIIHNDIAYTISTKSFISKDKANRLKDAGVTRIQVSIDSIDRNMADILTGSKGFFDEIVQTITNLINCGIIVNTNSIITPFNLETVPKLIDYLAELGVKRMGFGSPSRSLYNGNVSDILFLNTSELNQLKDYVDMARVKYPHIYFKPIDIPIIDKLSNEEKIEQYKDRSFCSAGRSGFIIHENGDVVLCEECPVSDELVVGNVKENKIIDVWNSKRIDKLIYPDREKYIGTECFNCSDSEYDECHLIKGRCWRESLKAYNKIYAPAPKCVKAPVGKKTS